MGLEAMPGNRRVRRRSLALGSDLYRWRQAVESVPRVREEISLPRPARTTGIECPLATGFKERKRKRAGLRPFHIFAGTGIHFHFLACLDEQRYLDRDPGFQRHRLLHVV